MHIFTDDCILHRPTANSKDFNISQSDLNIFLVHVLTNANVVKNLQIFRLLQSYLQIWNVHNHLR